MHRICVLGLGPAAIATAILLKREGYGVEVIGTERVQDAVEGVSWRAVDGLEKIGISGLREFLGPRWKRYSAWNDRSIEGNGEYVVNRIAFDKFLYKSLKKYSIPVCKARVENVSDIEGKIYVVKDSDCCGREVSEQCYDFLVDARGRGSPKKIRNESEGPISLALTRRYCNGHIYGDFRTYSEPFENGWAWVTHDQFGCGSIQIVIDPKYINVFDGDFRNLTDSLFKNLTYINKCVGPDIVFKDAVIVRGIRPVLRGELVSSRTVCVGDACYSGDPLSGHGIYEAISGSFAALAVINTIIRRPDSALIAKNYYVDRARQIFMSRINVAQEFYSMERRWASSGFWVDRFEQFDKMFSNAKTNITFPVFVNRPVVEYGYVVERRVALSKNNIRGVRFIDGVDLACLYDEIKQFSNGVSLKELCHKFGVTKYSVMNAIKWLFLNKFLPDFKIISDM
ncbi:MAG: hypothetical protein IV101_03745 [Dechloromonas sp.]|uniref:flavin-dependent monooxygenase QhpG n=1 Tax=Dechloromonas sp. TaxID=1917218 RepID=UPI0027EDF429|nr:hypothetical protein [Dechloromonas sp.]MBT9519986.1 hypothetical protein [Dechloromonas sp.]